MLKLFLFFMLLGMPALAEVMEDAPPFGLEAEALAGAWGHSCEVILKKPAAGLVKTGEAALGRWSDWQRVCQETTGKDAVGVVRTLNKRLRVVWMDKPAKFTAYYKPILTGSRVRESKNQVPLLAMPARLKGCEKAKGAGCPTRAQIGREMAAGRGDYEVLMWLDDPMGAFLLHIQGSGTVKVREGKTERFVNVGFAGKNGHPYTAIGKVLREQGELSGDIDMPKIVGWVRAHEADEPEKIRALFEANESYIFFVETAGEAPGAMGVTLTAGRSVAVDRTVVPLGLPVLVETELSKDGSRFKRVMMAQDVGSAIVGEARGDLFLGHGEAAGEYAGVQNAGGRMGFLVIK